MLASHLNDAILTCEQTLRTGMGFETACQTLGNVLQGMGRFEEAILWHSRALEHQPNLVEIYASLGGLYAKQQQWQQAIAAYNHALSLDPNYAEAYRSLASIYGQIGQRQAEVTYRYQAVTLKPSWATPQNQIALGNALMGLDKWDEAIDCYRRAIQIQPDLLEAHYNLGVALAQQQQWQPASAAFHCALELNPNHAESHYGLGKMVEQQDQLQQALAHYRQAAKLNPNSVNTHYSLGETLLKLRQWEEASSVYRRAVELQPDFSWSHHNLGYALLKQNQWLEAVKILHLATELNPDSPWTYYHLGDGLLHQEQWQEASTAFLKAIQLQPDLAGIYPKLGRALRRQSQSGLTETIGCYQQAIGLKPENYSPDFCVQIGNQLSNYRQFDGAAIFYELALLLKPQDAEIRSQAQQAWSAKQKLDQEIVAHRREIQQHPDYAWLYTHLGNLLADQGELEEAIELHRNGGVLKGWQCAASRNYQFTHDWFTHNIPTWAAQLKPFAHYPNVQALEVGSFEGMSACWLLDHILTHPLARLTCIDRYFQEKFETNLAQTEATAKLIKLLGDSHAVLASLRPDSYDIIYIDGCHLADHVRQDAMLSWQLLKVGGLLIFDDYEWTDPNYPGQDTQIGIDTFLNSVQKQITVVHKGYQVIVKKLRQSEDLHRFDQISNTLSWQMASVRPDEDSA
jgi:tetratricopeptide (TPR) repeat protein/predicted O-methyltransferase YrrM